MPVRVAEKVGFCFGVKRAIEMAHEVLKKERRAYSLGSIIHNRQVVEDLSRRGLEVINKIDKAKGCLVISSHGISPKKNREISRRSLKVIDTTCPFVRNAQKMARSLRREGYRVLIVGDANHPEVRALVDYAGNKAIVVKDARDRAIKALKPASRLGVLSQTTQSMSNFLEVVKAVMEKRPRELKVYNTICRDAEERQLAASRVAREVELMLIVGGRNSANTRRLFEVCRKELKKSYLIETDEDVRSEWFRGVRSAGITSGASTPDWIVKKVAGSINLNLKGKEGCKKSKW